MTLLAVADDGSKFVGWSEACTGTDPCALTMEADTQLTATFDRLDRSPPHVSTLRASAKHGTTAQLRFRVWDDSGKSREELTVLDGKLKLMQRQVPLRTVIYRHVYSVGWRVPADLHPGVMRFCAVGVDEVGNRSVKSCSALAIT